MSGPNREKRRAPKTGLGWCHACDRARVAHGSKCPACGARDGLRREKKTGQFIEQARKYLDSLEGQQALRQIVANAKLTAKKLAEASRVDPDVLRRPMDF